MYVSAHYDNLKMLLRCFKVGVYIQKAKSSTAKVALPAFLGYKLRQ